MRTRPAPVAVVMLAIGLGVAAPAMGEEGLIQEGPVARLGKAGFTVECAAGVQQAFDHAMALYHAFAWGPAMQSFADIAEADPACGMAHWARAKVMLDHLLVWPGSRLPPAKLSAIAAALDAARAAGLKSQRERDYVAAAELFVRDRENLGHGARLHAYREAIARLAERYAHDWGR